MKELKSFVGEITEQIQGYLPENIRDMTPRLIESGYNKETKYPTLLLCSQKHHICPDIDFEEYYEAYKNGTEKEEILAKMAGSCTEAEESFRKYAGVPHEYDEIKDSIFHTVVNAEDYEEILPAVPHAEQDGLAVVCRQYMITEEDIPCITLIDNVYMEQNGIVPDTLWELAEKNTKELLPLSLYSMEGVINAGQTETIESSQVYRLTNQTGYYGATCLFEEDMLKSVAERVGGNFLAYPANVNETLIVAGAEDMEAGEVRELAENCLPAYPCQAERLSDTVFCYDAGSQELYKVIEEGQQQEESEGMTMGM